jgi:hypothetical protein
MSMDVGLGMKRGPSETWRQAVERIAKVYGLERECLEDFDAAIAAGEAEDRAAWCALYDWDVLDLYVDGKPSS